MLFLVVAIAMSTPVASAAADTTLGSKLEHGYESTFGGTTGITVYQEAASGEVLTAPSGGTITSWRVRSGDLNAQYELRVIRPVAGEFTAAGTSAPQTVPDSEDKTRGPFAVTLPVKAGDRIALYVIKGGGAPINTTLAPLADQLNYLQDPFADGTTKKPVLTPPLGGNQELLLQANFTPAPPVNIASPIVSGEARAGSPLTASEGTWENAASFAFQWVRCAGAACSGIAGAVSHTYTATAADEGQQLRVDVTATGEGGKTTASSELTDGVKPAPPAAPTSTGPPVLSGEPRETEMLSGTNGNWTGSPTQFQYQWLRCSSATGTNCAPVSGATSSSLRLVHTDAGSTMRLAVTATNTVGPTTAESAPSAIVQPLTVRAHLVVTPSPTCTGIRTVFDASGSQTPNLPITRYRFTYVEFPALYGFVAQNRHEDPEQYLSTLPVHVLADGTSATPKVVFTWNRRWTHELDFGLASALSQDYVRDPILLTLEVTDLAGATAKTSQVVNFSTFGTQYSGDGNSLGQGRTGCPDESLLLRLASLRLVTTATLSKSSIASTIRCVTLAPCAGAISILSARSFVVAVKSKAKTKRRRLAIASSRFFLVAGHHRARVRSKLTKAGRALLKHSKTIKVVMQLTSITPAGKATTRSVHATLRRK